MHFLGSCPTVETSSSNSSLYIKFCLSPRMSAADELKFEKEVDQIEAELGDDYLVRLLQCLTSSSPEANRGLLELHSECQNVVSKYPPMRTDDEKPKKRTQSQGTMRHEIHEFLGEVSNATPPRHHRVQTNVSATQATNYADETNKFADSAEHPQKHRNMKLSRVFLSYSFLKR
ncbi:hypothetical protein NECAME_08177 [Necator americanus]|uniref:Uncharacterized protein n=1 Tax=Necator americanus TaxID=51031 RepID=W2TJV1_NECAM|nr:hypothetical protein NECAME_08177 [Necator americanus]ETN82078.1 hypothetical protein NECAME_08177 [Necator americanus]